MIKDIFFAQSSIRLVSISKSGEHLIPEFVDLTSTTISKLIPNAEPEPVAIAFTIVAEPGDRTIFFH